MGNCTHRRKIEEQSKEREKFSRQIYVYYMKSPKLPVGPVGKIRLLGGAAPLSS